MRLPKFLVVLVLLLVGGMGAFAQTKSTRSARFHVPKISRSKALIMCPIFLDSKYPYQGLGLKLGDPFALTYKFYPSKHWAFAADGGKAASGLYNRYYRNVFNNYLPDSLKLNKDQSVKYLAHKALSDWFLEAKFLYQWDATKLAQGLQLYAGLGWQWRKTTLQYDYLFEDGVIESKFGKFNESRFTFGPVAVVGFEYSYFTLPISAFIEIEWFTDALLDPGYQRFQGGVGLRYVF
jgi:hypothetical protein